MRALVTGATGFLGGNLARHLVDKGWQVCCLYRAGADPRLINERPVEWVELSGDVSRQVRALARTVDVVFHCAAQVGTTNAVTSAMAEANTGLTSQILDGLGDSTRLVYTSTVATCAVSEQGELVDEETPWNLDKFNMAGGYTRTKLDAENAVLEAASRGIDAVVVNPAFMFGPGDVKLSSNRMILDVYNGKIPAFPPGANNYVDVRDVADGMVRAAEKGRSGERYILAGENLSYRELFATIAEITGAKPINRPLTKPLAKMLALFGDLKERLTGRNSLLNSTGIAWSFADARYSSAKAERELGYRHGPIEPAIADAFEWFRAHGYI